MTKKPFFELVREREPNFDRINAALDEFAAGRPVTQRTVDTNEPIFIIDNRLLGDTFVIAGNRLLAHFKFLPNYDVPREQVRRVSTFVDPETGETIAPGQSERRSSDKPSTDPGTDD